jgi:hypothetical protein
MKLVNIEISSFRSIRHKVSIAEKTSRLFTLMAHFSLAEFYVKSIPPQAWFLKSTLPDIALAWADFFIGKALYDLTIKEPIQGDTSRL